MENQTPFDLNEAIRCWRTNLESSPSLTPENISELETHLRDSTVTLHAQGISEEEAFWLAARRLGCGKELDREYHKVNPKAVWFSRVLWMLVGIYSLKIMGMLTGGVVWGFLTGSRVFFPDSIWIPAAGATVNLAVFLGLIAAAFWFISTCRQACASCVNFCLKHPIIFFGVLAMIQIGLITAFMAGLLVFYSEKQMQMQIGADSRLLKNVTLLIHLVLLPMAIVYLARRRNAFVASSEAQIRRPPTAS